MSETPASSLAASPHDRLAETYRTGLARVTAKAIAPLLDAVSAGPDMRLLDIGCGPGDLVAAAARRGALAAGTDLAPGMVAVAARMFPDLDFRVAPADEFGPAMSYLVTEGTETLLESTVPVPRWCTFPRLGSCDQATARTHGIRLSIARRSASQATRSA